MYRFVRPEKTQVIAKLLQVENNVGESSFIIFCNDQTTPGVLY